MIANMHIYIANLTHPLLDTPSACFSPVAGRIQGAQDFEACAGHCGDSAPFGRGCPVCCPELAR